MQPTQQPKSRGLQLTSGLKPVTSKMGANAVDFAAKHHANFWGPDLP